MFQSDRYERRSVNFARTYGNIQQYTYIPEAEMDLESRFVREIKKIMGFAARRYVLQSAARFGIIQTKIHNMTRRCASKIDGDDSRGGCDWIGRSTNGKFQWLQRSQFAVRGGLSDAKPHQSE
jgi:hypothetical protein